MLVHEASAEVKATSRGQGRGQAKNKTHKACTRWK